MQDIQSIDFSYHASQWLPYNLEEDVKKIIQLATEKLDIRVPFEMSIVFADDCLLQELNSKYRKKDKPTDVLSFPQESFSRGEKISVENLNFGDIILSYETIERDAQLQEKKFLHHSLHMIVHGFLHLMGYDHQDDREAEEMESLEISILTEAGIPNPYE